MTVARLVLVGLPGVGKSSVAQLVAAGWDCEAIDTDDVVAQQVGCTAAEFLRREGVQAFREAEVAALRRALDVGAVVATGGGVVETPEARAILRGENTLWLDVDDDVLVARLADGDRPLLTGDVHQALARLREVRAPFYRDVARERVCATGPAPDVAEEVRRIAEGFS